MRDAVKEYRERRQKRLDARMDSNTRLPFGLCQQQGIEIGEDWTPEDAWSALAEKGITPESAYGNVGKKDSFKTRTGAEYKNLFAKKDKDGQYSLHGDLKMKWGSGFQEVKGAKHETFINKDEMFAYLQEMGVEKFKDPDTGEIVNPKEMDLPKTVAKIGARRYKELTLGFRTNKTGHPATTRGFAIAGQDFTGKRTVLKVFYKVKDAEEYARKIGCSDENLRRTADFKKYMAKLNKGAA